MTRAWGKRRKADPEPKSSLNVELLTTSMSSERGTQEVLLSLLLPRYAFLEERVNVYLQGHLNEIYYLKQNLAWAEEKMVCLSYKKAKEMWMSTLWGIFLRNGQ